MDSQPPTIYLNTVGDQLEVKWNRDVAEVAKWKNRYLTILYSAVDREEIVGIVITNLSSFMKTGIRVDEFYDECPALTPAEEARVDEIIEELLHEREAVYGPQISDEEYENMRDELNEDMFRGP